MCPDKAASLTWGATVIATAEALLVQHRSAGCGACSQLSLLPTSTLTSPRVGPGVLRFADGETEPEPRKQEAWEQPTGLLPSAHTSLCPDGSTVLGVLTPGFSPNPGEHEVLRGDERGWEWAQLCKREQWQHGPGAWPLPVVTR